MSHESTLSCLRLIPPAARGRVDFQLVGLRVARTQVLPHQLNPSIEEIMRQPKPSRGVAVEARASHLPAPLNAPSR
jgi:hypothetical protein